MRALFCGNLEYDVRQSEVERLFKKYGRVERVDMKTGFAFVYMEDERDADAAIRKLDRYEFGRKGRRLRVEWTKQERDNRRPAAGRKPAPNERPSKTLFVINFDPVYTKSKDLESHFAPYGKIVNIRVRRNFAFIQFENQEEATTALEETNMSKLMDRVITVEYAIRDDDRGNDRSPGRRGRDYSPDRGYGRRRSPSPRRRERGSPDYGFGRERGSPDYGRGAKHGRGSPEYGRHESPANARSPSPPRVRRHESPANGRRYDSRSPPARERRQESPVNGRRSYDSRSPPARERRQESPVNGRRSYDSRSPPPRERKDESPDGKRYESQSPPRRERSRS